MKIKDKTKGKTNDPPATDKKDAKNWEYFKELLDIHSRNVLERKTLLPIFIGRVPSEKVNGPMSIDVLFEQLFQKSVECPSICISQCLIEINTFSYIIRTGKSREDNYKVVLKQTTDVSDKSPVEALKNISRLYYGLRCTLTHGKHKKTLEGCLKDFPESEEDFPLPDTCESKSDIVKYYIRLFRWTKKYGREIWVNYLTLLNITRFYKTAAFSLMLALAKWLYTILEINIWGYNPDRSFNPDSNS